jgi:predicted DNA-binding protein with PD1-like motif
MSLNGCHVIEGNIVLATIEVVITELLDMRISRNYHEESGFYFFQPQQ